MFPEGSRLAQHLALWLAGIPQEVAFWDRWFASKGDQWPDDYRARLDPRREIDPALLHGLSGARVLDVGAGPMTILGPCHRGERLDLTACDPLAPFYAEIAARHGVDRPVPTQIGFAEYLSAFFPADSFDLVHCCNALDHSFDPIRGIEEMLIVAKPQGRIRLSHARNEGETENYVGLHQWNFDDVGGDFIIWNAARRINATERLAAYADISVKVAGERWIDVELRKKASPAGMPRGDQLTEVLVALVMSAGATAR